MGENLLNLLKEENGNRNDEYLEVADVNDDLVAKLQILSTLPNVNITGVRVVNNNYLQGMYELKKMEYKSRYGSVTERLLIHATSFSNVNSIIKNNLDWRRVTRSKYGKGVSFSDDADYANYHSNSMNGASRAFIIAKVLIAQKTTGNCLMEVPPLNADTSVSNHGKVFVKFNDNEFLLKYVVYYNAPERTTSKHHRRYGRRRF